ncbi:MAG: GMC family oxidoreductase [Gemmatimonadetes bacterium]|nr:GMC family oxidoreductase [Gemmatimonadota bacterium]
MLAFPIREERERVLQSWAFSTSALRRAGFQALKRLVHLAHYCWPQGDQSHAAWRAVGYPGPLPVPSSLPEPLPTVEVTRDTTFECDVVVCGSGAGGGVVAGVLAQAGKSVVVLEKGRNPLPSAMTQIEGDMLSAWYLDGGLVMTQSGSMPILAGSCLGGGTVINYTTAFPLPPPVREEWDARSGLGVFTSQRFAQSLERVSIRSGLGTCWNTPGERDALLERGCRALGWHVEAQPRNVTDCAEGLECGYCGYGCRRGAKNSTDRTYLRDAAAAGARLVVRCDVERVMHERGRVTGVAATVRSSRPPVRLMVRARSVVVACGAIHTPAVLRRSGLTSPVIGQGLRLHPATAVAGVFPHRVEPWSGALQTRYSEAFADLDAGYGARFETAPVHFALPASGFGWESARRFRHDLSRLGHTSIVGVLLRDRDAGRVAVGRDGRPRVHYELSDYDAGHVRRALLGAAEVLAAAGAQEIFTLHTPPARARPGTPNWRARLIAEADSRGYQRARLSYISFHQMGTASLGRDPATSAAGETGELPERRGLYVADGSAFPTSSGVNPMITIMAIADHVARAIGEAE